MKSQFNPIIKGGYDFHIHTAPSIFTRKQTDWELLEDAILAEMGGFVLKSHESSTVERAFLLRDKAPNMNVFGGIVLNQQVGGINPYAVEAALKMGGKVVWCPTISAAQHQLYFSHKSTKLFNGNPLLSASIVSTQKEGCLVSEMYDIFSLIKEYDTVLATGHLSLQEQHYIVDEAMKFGLKKILIQHADMGISKIPIEDQLYFAAKGCLLEKCYLACSSDFNDLTVAEMAQTIKRVGYECCILVTDFGQPHNAPPVLAFNQFIEALLLEGISEVQIRKMIVDNPELLLGVENRN